ncbi:MAG: alcohol dehydrogenase catalytic domain-containing protein [Limisphaerales bacterium]
MKRASASSSIPRTMTAVVYRGPHDLRVEQLEVPRTGPGDLLVRVAVCGVCPTDIKKIQYGTAAPPRVFGHETSGVIVRTGALVRGFKPGDRVALHHHVPCLKCHACRHRAFAQCATYKRTGITAGFEPAGGGYAEYVRVMPFVLPGVVKIPAKNSFLEGALLEPVNTVLKAVRRLNLLRGDVVLVAGQGPIGLMFTRLLALAGVTVLATDLMPARLDRAREFGANHVARGDDPALPARIERLTKQRGLDAAVIAVPSDQLVRQMQDLVRGGGQVLLFAHTKRGSTAALDLTAVCVDEKDVLGSYSADLTIQKEVARLVFGRKLDTRQLVSHEYPLVETAEAVRVAANPTESSLKVIVRQLPG